MPDKKGKRSSKSSSKSSRTHRKSRIDDQSGEIPRDPKVDRQLLDELYSLVLEREQLQSQFGNLVAQLAARRQGIQTAEELYNNLINMDFRLIRGLSSSANMARERRGARHESHKNHQTEEIDADMHFYRELNRATAMQRGIEAIPQSLDQFTADEQAIVMSLASTQEALIQGNRRIMELQTWLQFFTGKELEPRDFNSFGGDDGYDDDGGDGFTLDTGENIAY